MSGLGRCHPACALLPELSADQYRELVDDIREHGLRHAIVRDEDGLILDGRHRWRACQDLGIEPLTEMFSGSEAAKIALVISENVHRRHLTTQQRAAIGAELATMKSGARTDLPPNDGRSEMSSAQAAKTVGVSPRSVERAKQRMRADPAAHAQAKAGTLPRKPAAPASRSWVDETAAESRRAATVLKRALANSDPPEPEQAAPVLNPVAWSWVNSGPIEDVVYRIRAELTPGRIAELVARLGGQTLH
jgi:hypothetical protein